MVISMIVYTLIPFQGFGMKLLSRIVLLPVITGLSYELIRFAAKRRGSFLALLTAPGTVAAAHHHAAAFERTDRSRDLRARPRHGARDRRRAANWSSPKRTCNSLGKLDQIEVRFEELTQPAGRSRRDPATPISIAKRPRPTASCPRSWPSIASGRRPRASSRRPAP